MASTPRVTLDDSYTLGITCAICGTDALKVNHVSNMPDYVACAACSSAFLVEEGGDRVFYGQITDGYPEAQRFALKQWAWLEAVETRAREERPAPVDTGSEYPPEEIPATPTPVEVAEADVPAAESVSAEDWISSEIHLEDLLEESGAREIAPEDPVELFESEASKVEIPATADEKPFSFQPFDIEEQDTSSEPDVQPAEDQSLTDFFEALTDDTGDVAPIVEPDEYLTEEDAPVEGEFDADLERLLQTDDDGGPDLPKPPWAAEREPEIASPAEEAPLEEVPSWDRLADLEPIAEGDAVPVVDAKDETYESLPSFKNLDEPGPTPDSDAAPEIPDWGAGADKQPADGIPAWADFDDEESLAEQEAAPEPPAWALPADEESLEPTAETEGTEDQSWKAAGIEEPSPGWQQVPQASSEESFKDDDDFLADLRRSAGVPLESQPIVDQPISEFDDAEAEVPWDIGADDFSARIESVAQPVDRPERVAAGWEMTAAAAVVDPTPEPEPELSESMPPIEDEVYVPPASDPPMGQRYRVVIRGEHVIFPRGDCAHCGRTPEKGKLAVAGTLPRGQAVGQRRPTRFEVPLCANCRSRAAAKSEEARAAQLQAHLISAIVGMVLVVGALAMDLINPRDLEIADLFLGLILLIVGYGGPAFFLLNRVGNYLPPVDARYVRTTLLVPSETQGLETAFEWRNNEYAQRFHETNQANTLGNMTSIKDRIG